MEGRNFLSKSNLKRFRDLYPQTSIAKRAIFLMTNFLQIKAQTLSSVTGTALAPCYVGDVHSNI